MECCLNPDGQTSECCSMWKYPAFPGKQNSHGSLLSCHVLACLICLLSMFLSDWDTWWHTCNGPAPNSHILPYTRSRFPLQPLARIDRHVHRDGGWRARLSAGRLTTTTSLSLSAGSWHGNMVMMWVFRCKRRDCWLWTGLVLAAHQAACCYLGWLTNKAERQREVCLHHVFLLIFSLIRRHSDTVRRLWMRTCCSLGQSGTFLRSVMERGAELNLCWASWFKSRCVFKIQKWWKLWYPGGLGISYYYWSAFSRILLFCFSSKLN